MKKFSVVLLLLIALVGGMISFNYYNSTETVTIKVTDKERISEGSGEALSHKFLVYSDTEVFENTDTLVFLKFNSTDFQNKLKVDSTYQVRVVGWRLPFFSSYRNIIEFK